MMRKFTAMVSAAALVATAFAPASQAHDWRGYHGGHYGRYYRYDHGNSAAAGIVGLVFGLGTVVSGVFGKTCSSINNSVSQSNTCP